eukprot:11837359-Alexandrium_andersonii.AAC.1
MTPTQTRRRRHAPAQAQGGQQARISLNTCKTGTMRTSAREPPAQAPRIIRTPPTLKRRTARRRRATGNTGSGGRRQNMDR